MPVADERARVTGAQSHDADGSIALELPVELVEPIARRAAEIIQEREANPTIEPWIGVREAAEHLHCRPQRIYSLVHQGRLEPRRDGSRLLFRRSELDYWLATSGGHENRFGRRDGIRDGR